jgi:hypothetical protein
MVFVMQEVLRRQYEEGRFFQLTAENGGFFIFGLLGWECK